MCAEFYFILYLYPLDTARSCQHSDAEPTDSTAVNVDVVVPGRDLVGILVVSVGTE